MRGDAAGALAELSAQYADGADPMAVLRDLAEVTHWVSVIQITPEAADDPTVAPDERDRGRDMARRLPMRALTRMWQMLLKALEEVAQAPNAMMAAEMAVIRLTHVADLPSPEELVRKLQESPPADAPAPVRRRSDPRAEWRGPRRRGRRHRRPRPAPRPRRRRRPGPRDAVRGPVTALAAETDTALARFPRFE